MLRSVIWAAFPLDMLDSEAAFRAPWMRLEVPASITGDTAHAMLPRHGQGTNTTIGGSVVMAELLFEIGLHDPGTTLDRFGSLRRTRAGHLRRDENPPWLPFMTSLQAGFIDASVCATR